MKVKLSLSKAQALAEKIKAALAPACDRIEIAGSIRRGKARVGDIEIVAIAKMGMSPSAQLSLFSNEPPRLFSKLDMLLDRMVREKANFSRGDKNGPAHKTFLVNVPGEDESTAHVQLDLYITTFDQWGYILGLRTGPADFNRAWVTQGSKGGLLPDRFKCEGGNLHIDGEPVPTPDERSFFVTILGQYLEPEERENWRGYFR